MKSIFESSIENPILLTTHYENIALAEITRQLQAYYSDRYEHEPILHIIIPRQAEIKIIESMNSSHFKQRTFPKEALLNGAKVYFTNSVPVHADKFDIYQCAAFAYNALDPTELFAAFALERIDNQVLFHLAIEVNL